MKTLVKILTLIFIFILLIIAINYSGSSANNIDYIRGENAFENQQYDYAKQYYLDDLKSNPKRVDSLNYLALSYIRGSAKSITQTIKYYQKFINHPQINSLISVGLIQNFNTFGMTEELNQLKDIIDSEFHLAHIWLYIDINQALKHIMLVPKDKQDLEYYKLFAQITFKLQDYSQAIVLIDKAIQLGCMDNNIYYLKSQALLRMRQIPESRKAIETYQLMLSFRSQIRPDEKLTNILTLINNNPDLGKLNEFKVLLLTLLLNNNNKNESLKAFSNLDITTITSTNRRKILAAALKAQIYEIIEDLFQSTNKKMITAGEAVIYCQGLGNTMDTGDVIDFCQQAVKNHPDIAPLYFWHGILLLNGGYTKLAIEHILIAIDYAPWLNEWRIQLAQIYLTEGQIELANKILDQSTTNNQLSIKQFKLKNGL